MRKTFTVPDWFLEHPAALIAFIARRGRFIEASNAADEDYKNNRVRITVEI